MTELRKTLGTIPLTLFGVGMILGAGVYSVIGAAAGRAGEGLWLAFAIASLVALLSALSYAELATAYPLAGAEYAYLRSAFPDRRWVRASIGALVALAAAATTGTVALSFAGYLATLVAAPEPLLAAGLIAAVSAINLVGVREAGWANAVATIIEASGLVVVIGLGVASPRFADALSAPVEWSGVLAGGSLVFFAFLGFENIANLAEEARTPRSLPVAVLSALAIATVLYVLVALAVVALADPEDLARSRAPLATAVGGSFARPLGVVALFATANTALIAILAGSRLLYRMGTDGDAPSVLGRVEARRRVPRNAVLVIGAGALLLLPLGDVGLVSAVSSFASLIAFAAVNVAVIALRRTDPDHERPFRVPLAIRGVPIPAALGCLGALAMAARLPLAAIAIGSAILLLAAVLARVIPLRR
jgi:APA family basic amino acid/polyamine antiporter